MTLIVALTPEAKTLAEKIANCMPELRVWYKPQPFVEVVQDAFLKGERIVFICALGIVIRTLAPVLRDKHTDPPVLVLDEAGRYVIPALSGHEGGANEWGRELATRIGAQLVLTSAQAYLEPVYMVGMGCERNCPASHLSQLLTECLSEAGLTEEDISGINSIDLKADEEGLIDLAEALDKSFQTFSSEALSTVDHQLSERSDYVYATVGVYGVAESAALYGAGQHTGQDAELVLTKKKTAKATCAIARSYRR